MLPTMSLIIFFCYHFLHLSSKVLWQPWSWQHVQNVICHCSLVYLDMHPINNMNLLHETSVTCKHCPCHTNAHTHTCVRAHIAEQSQAKVATYCHLTYSLLLWHSEDELRMDEWIDWLMDGWVDGSRIKVMERPQWCRLLWWSVMPESELFCSVSMLKQSSNICGLSWILMSSTNWWRLSNSNKM